MFAAWRRGPWFLIGSGIAFVIYRIVGT